jgi:hypothetical protein
LTRLNGGLFFAAAPHGFFWYMLRPLEKKFLGVSGMADPAELNFVVRNGVVDLLESAVADPTGEKGRQEGFRYHFDGDVCLMSQQEEFLRQMGFEVGRINVYPAVKTEDEFRRALRLIWTAKAEGWWLYRDKLTTYGICTEPEFDRARDRPAQNTDPATA